MLRLVLLVLALAPLTAGAATSLLDASGAPNPEYEHLAAWYEAGSGINGGAVPAEGTPVSWWQIGMESQRGNPSEPRGALRWAG